MTVASRLTPTMHDGEWGFWYKNSRTGKWVDLTGGKYGQQTALDIFENFWEGKLSPMAGLVRDVWNGKNFQGEPVTAPNAIMNLSLPLSIQNYHQIMSGPDSENIIWLMLAEGLGLSVASPIPK